VGTTTVHQLEKDGSRSRCATLEVVQQTLELAGVEFIEENGGGAGVRWQKGQSLRHRLKRADFADGALELRHRDTHELFRRVASVSSSP
jgi:hypothetical protein